MIGGLSNYDAWKLASPDDYADETEREDEVLQEEPCGAIEDLEDRCGD